MRTVLFARMTLQHLISFANMQAEDAAKGRAASPAAAPSGAATTPRRRISETRRSLGVRQPQLRRSVPELAARRRRLRVVVNND